MADLSLLIVNYRSAALTAEAVRTARSTVVGSLQIVVVDNSEDDAEAATLRALEIDELVRSPRNLGYGAAINLGRTSCTSSILAFSNPDVLYKPQCLDLLREAVQEGAALAGPLFSWDGAGEWLLPLPAMPTLGSKAIEILSARSRSVDAWRDRQGIATRSRQWSASSPIDVEALSGALIVTSADLFDHLAGFDERFFLYFEEIDLARRAKKHGPVVYVPQSVCRHLYGQTAPDTGFTNTRYLESERRFFEKWYGSAGKAVMQIGAPSPRTQIQTSDAWSIELPSAPDGLIVEASPSPRFPSAAGHFPRSAAVTIPTEIRESYRGGVLYVRVVDREGRVLYTIGFRKYG